MGAGYRRRRRRRPRHDGQREAFIAGLVGQAFALLAQHILLPLFFFAVMTHLIGCGLSSPRFGASRPPTPGGPGGYGDSFAVTREDAISDSAAFSVVQDSLSIRGRESNPAIDRRRMLSAIMAMMDTPYAAAGSDTDGIDCSGFTARIYSEVCCNILPHSCRAQSALGRAVDRRHLEVGDLVFFGAEKEPPPSHVGIYVGDGIFAHASSSRGVTLSLLGEPYFAERFLGARRLLVQ